MGNPEFKERKIERKAESPEIEEEIRLEGMEEKYKVKWEKLAIGSEAIVMRGMIEVEEKKIPVTMCKRISGYSEQVFNRHLVLGLIDEYFVRKGKYSFYHIPEPIGYLKDGYLYRYAKGSESFPWTVNREPIKLEEWSEFSRLFSTRGMRVYDDITDSDDGRISKNIIVEDYELSTFLSTASLPKEWKRIDFGGRSLHIDKKELKSFIEEEKEELRKHLGWKFDLLELTVKEIVEGLSGTEKEKRQELIKKHQRDILEKPSEE